MEQSAAGVPDQPRAPRLLSFVSAALLLPLLSGCGGESESYRVGEEAAFSMYNQAERMASGPEDFCQVMRDLWPSSIGGSANQSDQEDFYRGCVDRASEVAIPGV